MIRPKLPRPQRHADIQRRRPILHNRWALLGLHLDIALADDCGAIWEPATPWKQAPTVPLLTAKERLQIKDSWEREQLEQRLKEQGTREVERKARWKFQRQNANENRAAEVARRAAIKAEYFAKQPTPTLTFNPELGVDGPSVNFTQLAHGWSGVCSCCGSLGVVDEPYAGGLEHLNTAHRRAA